jgi:hypothetical protein
MMLSRMCRSLSITHSNLHLHLPLLPLTRRATMVPRVAMHPVASLPVRLTTVWSMSMEKMARVAWPRLMASVTRTAWLRSTRPTARTIWSTSNPLAREQEAWILPCSVVALRSEEFASSCMQTYLTIFLPRGVVKDALKHIDLAKVGLLCWYKEEKAMLLTSPLLKSMQSRLLITSHQRPAPRDVHRRFHFR